MKCNSGGSSMEASVQKVEKKKLVDGWWGVALCGDNLQGSAPINALIDCLLSANSINQLLSSYKVITGYAI